MLKGRHSPRVTMSPVCVSLKQGDRRYVLVVLLRAIGLWDVVQTVPENDNGPQHLHLGPDRI